MHLTRYTDYSLRLLVILGVDTGDGMTIQEVSSVYGISRNHLVKVVNQLAHLGVVETMRGRRGGVRLAMAPDEIAIGWVIRQVEASFDLAECFTLKGSCLIAPCCVYRRALHDALEAFHHVLDGVTLADLLAGRRDELRSLYGSPRPGLVVLRRRPRPRRLPDPPVEVAPPAPIAAPVAVAPTAPA